MMPATRAQLPALGLVMLLVTAPQSLLAETGRSANSAWAPVQPISYQQSTQPVTMPPGSPTKAPIYQPPHRLAPAQGVRVGGGTRAILGTVPAVIALVPDHTGLTSQASPTFYWYTASDAGAPVEFVLIHEMTGLPILEVRLPDPISAGIHAVHLADYGITLNDGETYTWSVALIANPNRRSRDVMVFGSVVRYATADLPAFLDAGAVEFFAGAGLWYDALHAATLSLGTTPLDSGLRIRQGALLRQVGLAEVADFVESASYDAPPNTN